MNTDPSGVDALPPSPRLRDELGDFGVEEILDAADAFTSGLLIDWDSDGLDVTAELAAFLERGQVYSGALMIPDGHQGQMSEELSSVLRPVLRDLQSSAVSGWQINDVGWVEDPEMVSAYFLIPGGETGFSFIRNDPHYESVARVADTIHEAVIEELPSLEQPTNWPRCPHHPTTHPLQPQAVDQAAVWWCPTDQLAIAAIGEL